MSYVDNFKKFVKKQEKLTETPSTEKTEKVEEQGAQTDLTALKKAMDDAAANKDRLEQQFKTAEASWRKAMDAYNAAVTTSVTNQQKADAEQAKLATQQTQQTTPTA